MSLHDELHAEWTAALARIAELEAQLAGQQPPPEPTPVGPQITTDVPTGWRQVIAEDFDVECGEGEFAGIYRPRGIEHYPRGYPDTRWKQNRQNGQAIRGGEYSADFISVADGICRQRLFVRPQPSNYSLAGTSVPAGTPVLQCSALVPIAVPGVGKWGDAPGMVYEHRSRFTYTAGIKSAHLLWPQVGTNTTGATGGGGNGEIDFPEFQVSDLVDCFIHHQGATVGNDQKLLETDADPREWHTYRLMWKMGQSVTIWVDGVQKGHYATRIPSTPMHLVLQNESWLDSAAIPLNAQGLVETDWIRVLVPA